jgi:hypothetical protein
MNDKELIWQKYKILLENQNQAHPYDFKYLGSLDGEDRVANKNIVDVQYIVPYFNARKTEGLEPILAQLTDSEKNLTKSIDLEPVYLYPVTFNYNDGKEINKYVYASNSYDSLKVFILTRYIDIYEDSYGEAGGEIQIMDTKNPNDFEQTNLGELYNTYY